ncbi:hypothetical protein WL578_12355, partial [Staphylococcus epidermidis]
MYIALMIMILLGLLIKRKSLLRRKSISIILVLLFLAQQITMVHDAKKITIEPYQSEFKTISDSSYRSKVLNRKINQMTKSSHDPSKRLDYFS